MWSEGEDRENAAKQMLELLKELEEKALGDKKFFGGDTINVVDIVHGSLAHWFEAMEELVGVKLLQPNTLPRLHAWANNFKQIPVIKDSLPDYDKTLAHFKGLKDMYANK